jgi:hypothetical protein
MSAAIRRCSGLLTVLFGLWLLGSHGSEAQTKRMARIGALTDSWGRTTAIVGFRDGLQELGYQENRDFVLGVRFTQGSATELPTAARDLVRHGVEYRFADGTSPRRLPPRRRLGTIGRRRWRENQLFQYRKVIRERSGTRPSRIPLEA